jgi:hypothetical protein
MMPQARALSGNGLAERRLTAEHEIARALVEASTFTEAVPRILEAICSALDWEHGALWEIDRQAEVLRCVQIWTAASVDFPEFNAAPGRPRSPGDWPARPCLGQRRAAWILTSQDTNFPRAVVAAYANSSMGLGSDPVAWHVVA